MSTNAIIAMQTEGGRYKGIYVHWDGYPAGVGLTLNLNYRTDSVVSELIKLGCLSSLGENSKSPSKLNTDGTIAYSRDLEEKFENVSPVIRKKLNSFLSVYPTVEYVYVYNNGFWYTFKTKNNMKELERINVNYLDFLETYKSKICKEDYLKYENILRGTL